MDLSAQRTTYKNITGYWSESRVWENGIIPPIDNLSGRTTINGTILLDGSLNNRYGQIIINDTLVIKGDLNLRQNSILIVNSNAVLIVQGNTYSTNRTSIQIDGAFIVKKDFIGFGSKSTIEFGADGKMFVIGGVLKGPKKNFSLLNCEPSGYPDNCYYGDLSKLEQDSIYSTYTSGGYKIYNKGSLNFCNGNSVSLFISPDVANIQWYKDGALLGGQTGDTLIANEYGLYYAQVTDHLSMQYTSNTIEVIVYNLPEVILGNDRQACYGDTVSLDGGDGYESYLWNTGETTKDIQISGLGQKEYSVTVEDRNGCSNISDGVVVSINPSPAATIIGSDTICNGQSITLTAQGGNTYQWNTGENTSIITTNPSENSTYSVIAGNEFNCTDTAYFDVVVKEGFDLSINGPSEVCLGSGTILSVPEGYDILWSTGETGLSIEVTPLTRTEISVNARNSKGCYDTATISIDIIESDPPNISGPLPGDSENSLILKASEGIAYLWNTGETTQSILYDPTVLTKYWVTVTNQDGCQETSIAKNAVCSYDYFSCAVNLGNITNWTSNDAAYSNTYASQDGNNASCLSEQPDKNVWFQFYAQTTINSIAIKTGNQYGTMKGQQMVVVDIDGNEVACTEASADYEGPLVLYTDLPAENSYYIMVDDRSTSGSFSLSINEYQSNNNFSDAYLIETPVSWISLPMQFTTLGATSDGEKITCTDERPNNNVWFKFKAVARTISIRVSAGENKGTITDPVITLYDASQEQLSCISQTGNNSVKLSFNDLTPNNWYYFAISNVNELAGSFTLSTNSNIIPGNIYYAVKDGDWNSNIWSENPDDTEGSGVIPSSDDIVYIKNHQVNVNTTVYAYSVYILLGNTSALNVSMGAKVELVKRMYLYNE